MLDYAVWFAMVFFWVMCQNKISAMGLMERLWVFCGDVHVRYVLGMLYVCFGWVGLFW